VHFVEWIDRDRRSYSLGIRIVDPRTGQILRGAARIESLRMRQDAILAEALLGPFTNGTMNFNTNGLDAEVGGEIMEAILQRVRLLAAHEVGHTLGLAHNFAGSTYEHDAASVMDYPPPIVTIDTLGDLVLNKVSYSDGIGEFDKIAINYGYGVFTSSDGSRVSFAEEEKILEQLIDEAESEGYVYLTDQDAGAMGLDWRDTAWDRGPDPIMELNISLAIRAAGLKRLSERAVPVGSPLSTLREVIPPVFLWHRYQVEAVVKLLGGVTFQYVLRGDQYEKHQLAVIVPGNVQRDAIDAVSQSHSYCCISCDVYLYSETSYHIRSFIFSSNPFYC
jgi:Met-zincin